MDMDEELASHRLQSLANVDADCTEAKASDSQRSELRADVSLRCSTHTADGAELTMVNELTFSRRYA